MDEVPLVILKRILQFLPRRTLEEVVVNVCQTWLDVATVIISENVKISTFWELPPGHGDDIGTGFCFIKPYKVNIYRVIELIFQFYKVRNFLKSV